jgi:endonuclease/exonuclease/phosphatase family metal-dependent hydrolase
MRVRKLEPAVTPGRALVLMTAALLSMGCAAGPPPQAADARVPLGACAAAARDDVGSISAHRVRWQIHSAPADRHELDEWCRGVGAPVFSATASSAALIDSLPIVTWNIHVGGANVDEFVAALRSGRLTGTPIPHFVLLLQEVRRNGSGVPVVLGSDARGTRQLGRRDTGPESDIVETARRLGLSLFYVPSMRNGSRGHPPEDRGNAILSSLPLTEPTAIELPLLAQRRVAVAATIPLLDAAGGARALRVSSVHLDLGARSSRFTSIFGAGRALQAGALADALGGYGNVIVGGDLNTWSLNRLEVGLSLLQEGFPDFRGTQDEPTFYTAGVLPRKLDHLFLRAADVSGSGPLRIADRFGSDHFPVIAWVRLDAVPVTSVAGTP